MRARLLLLLCTVALAGSLDARADNVRAPVSFEVIVGDELVGEGV